MLWQVKKGCISNSLVFQLGKIEKLGPHASRCNIQIADQQDLLSGYIQLADTSLLTDLPATSTITTNSNKPSTDAYSEQYLKAN
jgi:hypothetical protein